MIGESMHIHIYAQLSVRPLLFCICASAVSDIEATPKGWPPPPVSSLREAYSKTGRGLGKKAQRTRRITTKGESLQPSTKNRAGWAGPPKTAPVAHICACVWGPIQHAQLSVRPLLFCICASAVSDIEATPKGWPPPPVSSLREAYSKTGRGLGKKAQRTRRITTKGESLQPSTKNISPPFHAPLTWPWPYERGKLIGSPDQSRGLLTGQFQCGALLKPLIKVYTRCLNMRPTTAN